MCIARHVCTRLFMRLATAARPNPLLSPQTVCMSHEWPHASRSVGGPSHHGDKPSWWLKTVQAGWTKTHLSSANPNPSPTCYEVTREEGIKSHIFKKRGGL